MLKIYYASYLSWVPVTNNVQLYVRMPEETYSDEFLSLLSRYNPIVLSDSNERPYEGEDYLEFRRKDNYWCVRYPVKRPSPSQTHKKILKADEADFLFDVTNLIESKRLSNQNIGSELLVKAARGKSFSGGIPTVIDATAGLGRDGLLLSAAGFQVTQIERNELLSQLVRQVLQGCEDDAVTKRVDCICSDNLDFLRSGVSADIVYLDPMYSEGRASAREGLKKTAQVKKAARLLQLFDKWYCQSSGDNEVESDDGSSLLDHALNTATKKVVVKRAPKAPWLGNRKPSHSLAGKSVRFDVYAC